MLFDTMGSLSIMLSMGLVFLASELSENPTTGYRWEIKTLNANVIAFKDSNFSTDLGTGVGGGGTRTFNFNIRSSGTSKISLRLRREWELENLMIDQFEVLIQATKKGD